MGVVTTVNEYVRRAIKAAIKERGMTISEMAAAVGITQSEFSRRLHSDAGFSMDKFMEICAIVKKTPDEIYKKAVGA